MSQAAAIIRVMSGWTRRRVTVEVRLQTGERVAALWGLLETSGEYEFGAETEGELHYRVGEGEFGIDPRIVTRVVEPTEGSGTLVVQLHNDVELTITGPAPTT